MESIQHKTLLRIRTGDEALRNLKKRAAVQGFSAELYADMVFHYLMRERVTIGPADHPVETEDPVYFMVQIPLATKHRLSEWSERHQLNLASFSGALINLFLRQFERDPRDLILIHHVSSVLVGKPSLAESDLQEAFDLIAPSGPSLPPGYYARWLFSRLKPLITTIERNGQAENFTAQLVEDLLNRGPGE